MPKLEAAKGKPRPDASGTVLAVMWVGGASRRMGEDKASLDFGGRPLAAIAAEALMGACDRGLVLGRADQRELVSALGEGRWALRVDEGPGQGPLDALRGAIAARALSGVQTVVFSSCDLPRLRASDVVARLAAFTELRTRHPDAWALVPWTQTGQFTAAVVHLDAARVRMRALERSQRSLRSYFDAPGVHRWPQSQWPRAEALDDVDDPEELGAAERDLLSL